MTHYAIEVQLIKIDCKCSDHKNGQCMTTEKQKREKLREAYIGSFGHDVRHMSSALRKWNRLIQNGFEGSEQPFV